MKGLGASRDLENLLRSELAEHQVLIAQNLRFFQLKLPIRHPLLHPAHDILRSEDSGFLNSHQEVLHVKFQIPKLQLELGRIEHVDNKKHYIAMNVGVGHLFKENSLKIYIYKHIKGTKTERSTVT